MKALHQAWSITRAEIRYFCRHPKLFLAAIIVVLIPALYALIYLFSIWDPSANTRALTVALVNQDEGMSYGNQKFNVGQDVVARLKEDGRFGFREFKDEGEAQRLVREGSIAFALIIPSQFSSNAIPGILVGGGKPVVYVSEGNNYESAALAKHFAELLGQQINESLNEKRWSLVLTTAIGSEQSVERLRQGVAQLAKGAGELSSGAGQTANGTQALVVGSRQMAENVHQLTAGMKLLDSNLRLIDSHRPSHAELDQLKSGAEKLAASEVELQHGVQEIKTGTQQLQTGVRSFQEEASKSIWAPAALNDGLRRFSEGLDKLDEGVTTAAAAQDDITDGAGQLSVGVGKLANGMRVFGSGIHTIVGRLPLSSQLDQLASGAGALGAGTMKVEEATKSVATGARMLATGIAQLQRSLPAAVERPVGSPEGLAHSVEPIVERIAPVRNNGSGFAPNVIPAALWLGAGIVAFLLHVRTLPLEAEGSWPPAQLLGKVLLPSCLALAQAFIVLLAVKWVLAMEIANMGAFALTLAVASVSFFLITFALARAFGDAGKALAMVLLAVQLSSSSAILPVELSGKLFVDISPWLPLTWVVKALKASMFGAYDGNWLRPLLYASIGGVLAFIMGCTVGKWRFASAEATQPAIEL